MAEAPAAGPSGGASARGARKHPDEMSFLEHLDELRTRLIRCVIALAVSFAICGTYAVKLVELAERPIRPFLHGQKLVITRLTEGFLVYMKVAFLASLFLAAPYVLAELWLFVSPGLYKHERRMALPFVFIASLLFIGGGLFGYSYVFPTTCRFFLQVSEDFTPMIKVDEYLSLFNTIILGVGLVFEVPAVIYLLAKAGIVTPRLLLRFWRYAVLGSFVIAAVVTPTPDPITCTSVAGPMILLYFVGVAVAALVYRPRPSSIAPEAATIESP